MKRRWFIFGTAGLFTADQLLKTYVEQNLDKKEERKIAGPFVLRRIGNEGMCLGLLSEKPEIVRILALSAAGAVTLFQGAALMRRKGFWKRKGLCLLSAGAWSNTFDRFARGYVVDYIGLSLKDSKLAKLTFNLGDIFLAAGALVLSVQSIFSSSREKKRVSEDGDPEKGKLP
nr:signal peptidase II [uncultured Mediterraneibacter sp.]